MEDDIDIYEDLPNFNLKEDGSSTEYKTNTCECVELKKRVNELTEKLEKTEKLNKVLEVNLEALLNTAKAEITRKNKMIDSLRKELDNAAFRRGQFARPGPRSMPQYSAISKQTESSTSQSNNVEKPPVYTSNNSSKLPQQTYEEDENTEQQWEPNKYVSTVFGERLRKRITDELNEEKQRQSNKTQASSDLAKVKKEYVAESDKENGSEINIDNKENQSRLTIQNTNSDKINLQANVQCKTIDSSFTDNSNLTEENNTTTGTQHRPALIAKFSGKRTCEDMTSVPSSKRCKVETDQHKSIDDGDVWLNSTREWNNGHSIKKIDFRHTNHKSTIVSEDAKNSNCTNKHKPYDKRNNAENLKSAYHDKKDDSRLDRSDRNKNRYHLSNGNYSDSESSNHRYESKGSFCNKRGNHRCNNSGCNYYSKNRDDYYDRSKCHRYNRDPDFKFSDRRHGRHRVDKYDSDRDKYNRRRECKNKDTDHIDNFNKRSYDLRSKTKQTDERNSSVESTSSKSYRYRYQRWNDDRNSSTSDRSRSGSHDKINHKVADLSTMEKSKSTDQRNTTIKQEKDICTPKKNSKTENPCILEDGEIIDSPTPKKGNLCNPSTPEKPVTSEFKKSLVTRNLSTDIDKGNSQTLENTAVNNLIQDQLISPLAQLEQGNDSPREEKIENIEKFIKNYPYSSDTLVTNIAEKNSEEKLTKEYNVSDVKNILENLTTPDDYDTNENQEVIEHIKKQEIEETDTLKSEIKIENNESNKKNAATDSEENVNVQTSDEHIKDVNKNNSSDNNVHNEFIKDQESNKIENELEVQEKINSLHDSKTDKSESSNSDATSISDEKLKIEIAHEKNTKLVEDEVASKEHNISLKNNCLETDVKDHASETTTTESSAVPSVEKNPDMNTSLRTQNRVLIIARRRKPVQLSDKDASMMTVVNSNNAKPNTSTNNPSDVNASLKPRACKIARSYKDILSK